jgi:hypothetical protein
MKEIEVLDFETWIAVVWRRRRGGEEGVHLISLRKGCAG